MPFVNVRTARGLLTSAQKRELHDRITQVMVDVEGHGNPEFRRFLLVLIEESEPSNWSVHGAPLDERSIEELRESLQKR